MGWSRILIYSSCVCILFSSCCIPFLQKKFYTTEYGSNRPKKNKFKLSKNLNELHTIHTTDVYISNNKDTYYRFFSDNKFIVSGINPDININKQFNNLKKGRVGYYQVKDNIILFEYFSVGANDCGKYHQFQLKRIKDSIVGYTKLKVKGLTGVPDW